MFFKWKNSYYEKFRTNEKLNKKLQTTALQNTGAL